MKSIRVIGVALVLSAMLMLETAKIFFIAWFQSATLSQFSRVMIAVDPNNNMSTGMGIVPVFVLFLFCLGVGLILSVVVYAPFDDYVMDFFNARR